VKKRKRKSLTVEQVKKHAQQPVGKTPQYEGDIEKIISTGSTLLDLAISGGRVHGGGIPAGIMVEVFGPSSTGKTVLLCEIAGNVKRQGGQVMFHDPEARLNKQFARLFGLDVEEIEYQIPDTVSEVFKPIREWDPKPRGKVHGIFADSLAALTTEMEEEGKDSYGMRRAREFSEQCRLTCRELAKKGFLMVCSNQIRQNIDAGSFGPKYKSPGGEAIGFYSSLRLRCLNAEKIKKKKRIGGKEVVRVVGIKTEVEVFKSSVWKPYHTAPLYILYDYGIDDIRANLRFLKSTLGESVYKVGGKELAKRIEEAIAIVEEEGLEEELKKEVIKIWMEVENQFTVNRKPKVRG